MPISAYGAVSISSSSAQAMARWDESAFSLLPQYTGISPPFCKLILNDLDKCKVLYYDYTRIFTLVKLYLPRREEKFFAQDLALA
jgi:hypothetical protein